MKQSLFFLLVQDPETDIFWGFLAPEMGTIWKFLDIEFPKSSERIYNVRFLGQIMQYMTISDVVQSIDLLQVFILKFDVYLTIIYIEVCT